MFALSFAVCYTAVALLFRRRARRNARVVRPVTVRFEGREAHIPGWRDSGNDLHDPVTGMAAAVADRRALAALLAVFGFLPFGCHPADAANSPPGNARNPSVASDSFRNSRLDTFIMFFPLLTLQFSFYTLKVVPIVFPFVPSELTGLTAMVSFFPAGSCDCKMSTSSPSRRPPKHNSCTGAVARQAEI